MLALLGLLAVGAPAQPEATLELPPRGAMVALVVAPGVAPRRAETSSLLRALGEALEPETGLRVLSVEQAGLDLGRMLACRPIERLSCWTRELAGLEQGQLPIRYLVVLSVVRRDGASSSLSALLLDLDLARRRVERSDARDAEDALDEATVRAGPVPLSVADESNHAPVMRSLVGAGLQEALDRAGRWGSLGAIDLELPADGLLLEVDQLALGPIPRGSVRVARVPSGSHTLSLSRGARTAWTGRVEVSPGAALELRPDPALLRDPAESSGRRGLLTVGGLGVTAVGSAGLIAGLVMTSGRPPYACVAPSEPATGRCARPGGDDAPLLLAAGTGLAAAGLGVLVAALLDSDAPSDDPAWLPIVLGAAIGVAGSVAVGVARF